MLLLSSQIMLNVQNLLATRRMAVQSLEMEGVPLATSIIFAENSKENLEHKVCLSDEVNAIVGFWHTLLI
jgi:hypothetical protein